MDRRAFLTLAAASPLAARLALATTGREFAADLVVIGGGLGGVSAALAAAERGLRVVVTEPTMWVGGQLTSQAVPPDEHPWIETVGSSKSYRRLRTAIRDAVKRNEPLTAKAAADKALNPGLGTVSRLCCEPRVALSALYQLLSPHLTSGRVRLILNATPTAAEVDGDRVKSVTVAQAGRTITLTAPYFADATELGDLLALAKCEHVVGAESRAQTGEPHAPDRPDPLSQQAFTWCFAVDHRPGEDHTIPKPADYDFWATDVPKMTPPWPGPLLSWKGSLHTDPTKVRKLGFNPAGPVEKGAMNLWTYRRIVAAAQHDPAAGFRDVCLVNWPQNDYLIGPLVGVPEPDVARHLKRGRDLSLSLLYWMQTAAPRPDGGAGFPGLKLRDDILGTETGVAMAPYVREARRIQAEFTVTELHVGTEARADALKQKPGTFAAEQFPDTVGTGSYRIDLHPSSAGVNYVDVSSLPFQIPLGALIPKRIENLLPACKNLGVTHITNGCYRLHPVEWGIGEAVGHLVAYALAHKLSPRGVRAKHLKPFQDVLAKAGVDMEWPDELRTKTR